MSVVQRGKRQEHRLHLFFIESAGQVSWVGSQPSIDSDVLLVATSAEALEALEDSRLPFTAVGEYVDTGTLVSFMDQLARNIDELALEIESFMARRYRGARFEGPGFIYGHRYLLQYSVQSVASISVCMKETIAALSPRQVTVFDDNLYSWFAEGDGYTRNPWIDLIEEYCANHGLQFNIVKFHQPPPNPDSLVHPSGTKISTFLSKTLTRIASVSHRTGARIKRNVSGLLSGSLTVRDIADKLARRLKQPATTTLNCADEQPPAREQGPLRDLSSLSGLSLVLPQGAAYDWGPVVDALQDADAATCFELHGSLLGDRPWAKYFTGSMTRLWSKTYYDLAGETIDVNAEESEIMSRLFQEWMSGRPEIPKLCVHGMNVFPALAKRLETMASVGPALIRHNDMVAERILDVAKPDAVCFTALVYLADHRLVHHCREREIPVVCYQQGGGYLTQALPDIEQRELMHADYVLTHGSGVRPREDLPFKVRAKLVPVGSCRLESWSSREAAGKAFENGPAVRVLWIAAWCGKNVTGFCVPEDTTRYQLEKKCLRILAESSHLNVTYRPYAAQLAHAGIPRWIQRENLPIKVEVSMSTKDLMLDSDVIITNSNSTPVIEALALAKPLILYSPPDHLPVQPDVAKDLGQACTWARTGEKLVEVMRRLADHPVDVVSAVEAMAKTRYIDHYILHRSDGNCVDRVLAFMDERLPSRRGTQFSVDGRS